MDKNNKTIVRGALTFLTLMGIVSLFFDMTHEGARSILGEYLNLTGAFASVIGFISGFGELCGYSLRLLSQNLVFMGIRIILWGIGMGAQESIIKAAVSKIIPKNMRSTGFGIFETEFGIAWFLGSWLLGTLYEINPAMLVLVSVIFQMTAILFYVITIRSAKNENKDREIISGEV